MKHTLSIITIILFIFSYQFFHKEETPKQVNIPIQTHIEPERNVAVTQIKKPHSQNIETSTAQQDVKQKDLTKPKTQKEEVTVLPITETEISNDSQFLSASQINQIKTDLLILINKKRSLPVSMYTPLQNSANLRAREAYQKWSHTRPNGSRWNTTITHIVNINKVPHGENLAQTKINSNNISISQVVNSLHQGLINSSTHYKVMTNETYKKVNIGVYSKLNNNILTIVIAQHFIQ
ncbi:MAG: CAP domain-containing protein [Coprobacillus sp.]